MLLDDSPLTWNRNFIPNSDRPGAALNQPPFCASRSLDERERRDERTQPTRKPLRPTGKPRIQASARQLKS